MLLVSARTGKRSALGSIGIANDGTGTDTVGNYRVEFFDKSIPPRKIKTVAVNGHRRKDESVFRLLAKALKAGGYES